MYSLYDYGGMVGPDNRVRVEAYAQALHRAITPESVVLEIGTGAGFFSLLACQLGARHVYAVEPSDAIQVAREMAIANGVAEQITFVQDRSTEITLPERADVIVSDVRGGLPFLEGHIRAIVDARERLLAPRGVLIPGQDSVWAAVVAAPELYARYVVPWDANAYGLDLSIARRKVTNTYRKGKVAREQLLVEPQCWATLDYYSVETPDGGGELVWVARRAGIAHGLSVWFDSVLVANVAFSNAPGEPAMPMYSQMFFPWSAPVEVDIGDVITVSLRADLVGGRYVWQWASHVLDRGQPEQVKAHFKQSSFAGELRSVEWIRTQTPLTPRC